MPETSFSKSFNQPPVTHRSMPLWVWNGQVNPERITEMLEQYVEAGIGGVFIHPRPGLVTEYLGEEWMEGYRHALAECRRLGLVCNIYDENSYPSGFAGGHVNARAPHVHAQSLVARYYERPTTQDQYPIYPLHSVYRVRDGRTERLAGGLSPQEFMAEAPVLTLEHGRASACPWTAWAPLVSVLHPDTAREFLATTHEAYFTRFGEEFGASIQAIFTDEPLIATFGAYGVAAALPWSPLVSAEFAKDHGYELDDRVADLFVDQPGCEATRFDYYWTVQRLYTQNFMRPLYEWCEQHNVALTGHYLEHEWPRPIMTPDMMAAYRWLHWPGIDLLAPQFDFEKPEDRNHQVLLTVRELQSAVNQLGRERAFCEVHGVGGWDATFAEFKMLGDWLMVHGVNFYCHHLSWSTISGARKYDHPQTFSDHSPWWGDYRPLGDHVARLSVALTEGKAINRVLVLHPTTSGWVHTNPRLENDTHVTGVGLFSAALGNLAKSQGALIQWLCDHQVDFDLGDELLMEELGSDVKESKLAIGNGRYEVVILPDGMENWCESTLKLMQQWLASGGRILALGNAPRLINGRGDSRAVELGEQYRERWENVESLEALQARLEALVPMRLRPVDGNSLPPLVGHHYRELADGERLHFLVNTAHTPVAAQVRLAGRGLRRLDTFSGEIDPVAIDCDGEDMIANLELAPLGHALWLAGDAPLEGAPVASDAGREERIELTCFSRVERTEPNALMLDFCDLTVNGRTYEGLYVTAACRRAYQAHGFDANPWDRSIQYKRMFIDKTFGPETGLRAAYAFEIDSEAFDRLPDRDAIELAVERPHLYTITVNGTPVDFSKGRQWLDEEIRATCVGQHLRPGRNSIVLDARPFHVLCELERIYLLGNFGIEPATRGFRMIEPKGLTPGDWTQQGLVQYPGAVRYEAQWTQEAEAVLSAIRLNAWEGTVARVELDGRALGQIAFPPYNWSGEAPLTAGEHTLAIEVVGSLRNLLGPHFMEPSEFVWLGPQAWDIHPEQPAPGTDYRTVPYGLTGSVELTIRS